MNNINILIRHIALCKIREDVDRSTIEEIVKRFYAMKNKIEVIHDMEHSINIGNLDLADGYNHIFMVMFKSEAERDAYLPHEAHIEFGNFLSQYLDKTVGVDFWANNSPNNETHGY